jgi:glutaminyl-tRNA synthetase
VAENLARLRACATAQFADGAHGAARQDRHGQPNINLRDPAIYRIKHATHHNTGDALVHLPDVHLRAPDRGRAGEHHPLDLHAGIRGPAPVLRLAARAPGPRAACWPRPLPQQIRVRAPEPDLRGDQQAQADPAGGRRPRRGLGRPAHAHAGRHAPARLHAASIRRMAERTGASKTNIWIDYACWKARCATTWRGRRRARWRCSTRCRSKLTNWAEVFGRPSTAKPARRPAHPQRPELGQRHLPGPASCGSSARTSPRCRPRASSACSPGNKVRLKYGMVVECTGCEKDADGASPPCWPPWCPTPRAARRAPTRSRSRAPSPGSARTTRAGRDAPVRPPVHRGRSPMPAAATSARAEPGTAWRWSQGYVEPSLASGTAAPRPPGCSSSATATSSPTAS